MAVKIQLTPQELLSQSQEMLSLQKEFETLFGQSQTLLNQVNDNWSANLANNFSGKLLSAQKGFRQITSMLEAGGNLAAESAKSYESVDALLAKQISGDSPLASLFGGGGAGAVIGAAAAVDLGVTGMTGPNTFTDAVQNAMRDLVNQTKDDWKTAGSALEELEDMYDSLPKEYRSILDAARKKFVSSELDAAYGITKDIVTGDVSWDTAKKAGKVIIGGTKFAIIEGAIKEALDEERAARDAAYYDAEVAQLKKGNVAACLTLMGGSFVDEVLMGVWDVGGHVLVSKFVSKIPGMSFLKEQYGFDIVESFDKGMDTIRQGVIDGVNKAGEIVGKVEEGAREVIGNVAKGAAEGAKKVASAVGDGLEKVGDGLKKLWPF